MGFRAWWDRVARVVVKPDDELTIGCMGVEPSQLASHLNRIGRLTPTRGVGAPSSPEILALLDRAVEPQTLKPDGRYTTPRSYGVYELHNSSPGTARFHFGNHPVRQRELDQHFGSTQLIATFVNRCDAEDLSRLFNDVEFKSAPWLS